MCTQVLNESTFHHVQEKLQDERTNLEQKHTELDTQAQPALERAENLIVQLKNTQIEQNKKSQSADAVEGKARNKLTEATTQLETASTTLARTHEVLLAETPSLAESISEIDRAWVANERTVVTVALPEAQAAAQTLKEAQDSHDKAHTRVVTLREQRDPSAEPLGDHRANDEIATLAQEAATEAKICQDRVAKLGREQADLTRQAKEQAVTCARLAERASQGQQQAEQLDAEARVATSEADQLYEQLCSEWGTCLEDRTAYDTEKQRMETLRLDAGRLTELDQARGRLQGTEAELQHIATEEEQISLEHRLPVEQAKQAEADADQHLTTMRHSRHDAASAIDTFQQKRQANETYRQEMKRADRDVTTFSQLAELLKSGGPIQKAIAEQQQWRIASEANNILELLNDPLRIHIDQARRGRDTQDVTIIDTADVASGDVSALNRSRRYFEFLSGGEQFRVALALALALHRLVAGDTAGTLIVDEGFGALDSTRRDHLALQMANTSQGILSRNLVHSLIICSHSTEVQHHFRDSCWIVEKRSGTASVRRAEDDHS